MKSSFDRADFRLSPGPKLLHQLRSGYVSADPNYPEGLHTTTVSSSFPHSIWLDVDPVKRAPNLPSVIKSSITSAPLGGELGSVEQFRYCWGQLFFLLRKTTRPYFPGGHWIQILSESTLGQQRTDKSSRFGSGNCFVVCLCPSSVTCLKSSTSNKEREKKGVQPGCVFHWSSAAGRFVSYDMLVKFWGEKMCVDRFAQKKCSNW